MKSQNKTLLKVSILIFTLILLFSNTANAQSSTDALNDILLKINDFFEKEQYGQYAKIIDFFFFALLFISIYLIGVKYAFKQVNKPEKVIAVVLGLMSAFLMIAKGYSVTNLIPYMPWLLYILLFILIWFLLKGIQSKFWRFILALLLTLLIASLIEGVFDSEEFSESFAGLIFFKNGHKK